MDKKKKMKKVKKNIKILLTVSSNDDIVLLVLKKQINQGNLIRLFLSVCFLKKLGKKTLKKT